MTMGGNLGFGSGFIDELFEEEPNLAFQTNLSQRQGLSPNQRSFFENRFDSIFNQFLGDFGTRAQQSGEIPEFRFQDFIQDFNFEEDFMRRPPSLRFGAGTARFKPPTRFQFNR